jgi:opacity protein-like surface antigen
MSDDHVLHHQSSGLPFSLWFSVRGFDDFGLHGPSITGADDSLGAGSIFHVGVKHFLSQSLALRLFLDFATESTEVGTEKTSLTEYGIGVGVDHHFRPLYNISPYIGGNVRFLAGSGDLTLDSVASVGGRQQPQQIQLGEVSTSIFGIAAVAGFDWYISQNFAIGSEYSFGFTSASTKFTPPTGTATENTNTFIGFNPSGNLHMIVHF